MSNIMQKGKPPVHAKTLTDFRDVYSRKSLNGEQRRKDLIKITIENQAILQRLQKKSATYSVEKWEGDFEN